ncbi:ATP synthase subunit ATP5MJ, mitochondrial-like [Ursus americanus]|uniref:ATP synthase subunit ATP5MPL, mitochondrial-like n=1 Tax=Ursus maritimus TaxID=29073 RepID=A0A8M1G7D3_URSMA|nr:ATP synthase subunit ATP5MPL, mitochondrial-like [Ursus maritimus]XP_045639925.1 ATP synthase subunit ATP5MJ, mitochondrial-like [Ursus americanus]
MIQSLVKNVWVPVTPYSTQLNEIWIGMEFMGFIIYKIRVADKRSKALRASHPAPAHSHHRPVLLKSATSFGKTFKEYKRLYSEK